jgi:hypothetical protein
MAMADYQDRLKDYIGVNERIIAFIEKYPQGSLQSEIASLTETQVVMKAYAYRTADDARPAIGFSSLAIPGTTPYTRGSEIENAETSAWGRALAALGFEVKRGIASRNEIENKQDDGTLTQAWTDENAAHGFATLAQVAALWKTCVSAFAGNKAEATKWWEAELTKLGVTKKTMTPEHVKTLTAALLEFAPKETVEPAQHAEDINW